MRERERDERERERERENGQTDVVIVSGVCLQARVSSCLHTHAEEV